jgi:hypothetical protein
MISNSFLLSDAAPSGRPFTVNELLERARQIVERQHGNDARRVELLISIGEQYNAQDEDANARPVLEEACGISRGLADRSTRAQASCALGHAVSLADDPKRAEALIEEGLHELAGVPQYALDRVSCLLHGSAVARNIGEAQQGIARVQEAQGAPQHAPFDPEMRKLRVFMDLAEAAYPIVLRCIYTIALYRYYPITLYIFYLNCVERGLVPPGSAAPHPVADKVISAVSSSGGFASARESLCRGLRSRWFTERFHSNALVTHFQHSQVFRTARQLKDYAVTRCRLHQRAPQR